MISSAAPTQAYVWVWLPGATQPVVAGRLVSEDRRLVFNYGRSYLARAEAVPIYLPELPLQRGRIEPPTGLAMAGSLRDGAPDAWGRRVILNRLFGARREQLDSLELDELSYFLASASDRIGVLDFQHDARRYVPRGGAAATLEELLDAASRVERGLPLSTALAQALLHASSIGGARPKALIEEHSRKYVAKFSASTDLYNVVKGEFIAMRLAARAGLRVAPVQLTRSAGRDVLLIERFDRQRVADGWTRRAMVSALTLLGLDEMMARYASYEDLAGIIRHRFVNPRQTLRELFGRMVFNILCGNTDDHARNHAAFWDGSRLELTPAYDICPQGRAGGEASQAMLITGGNRSSRLATCLKAAHHFLLSPGEAREIIAAQLMAMDRGWPEVCGEASLSETERGFFWSRQFLNGFALEGLDGDAVGLASLGEEVRGRHLR